MLTMTILIFPNYPDQLSEEKCLKETGINMKL